MFAFRFMILFDDKQFRESRCLMVSSTGFHADKFFCFEQRVKTDEQGFGPYAKMKFAFRGLRHHRINACSRYVRGLFERHKVNVFAAARAPRSVYLRMPANNPHPFSFNMNFVHLSHFQTHLYKAFAKEAANASVNLLSLTVNYLYESRIRFVLSTCSLCAFAFE